MTRAQAALWASWLLFGLSTGLALQYASEGMTHTQWMGATAAVLGSLGLLLIVRIAPQPGRARP